MTLTRLGAVSANLSLRFSRSRHYLNRRLKPTLRAIDSPRPNLYVRLISLKCGHGLNPLGGARKQILINPNTFAIVQLRTHPHLLKSISDSLFECPLFLNARD